MTERKCGDCQLCCKLLPMKQNDSHNYRVRETLSQMVLAGIAHASDVHSIRADFDKPAGARCPYQKRRVGCAIYDKRPFGCRYWNCRWLVNDDTDDLSRPDRSHYVIDLLPDFITVDDDDVGPVNIEVVQVWVDPKHREAHRDPKLRAYLERRGKEGKLALIRFSEREAFVLFPPSLTKTGQWMEHGQTRCNAQERTVEERMTGLDSVVKPTTSSFDDALYRGYARPQEGDHD